uniref:AlNc14C43G3578 protein n=1 Tax=Albugo laibachii Nc14 TaxID=890382 RepID=F0WA34_9STRA|nr:AlNc14C43G3578 [Albugo laibachii Nc14]|eukprot:CCA18004.1 AlNc14C43G3578 [Albugo laibachii Nc14]
MRIPIIDHRAHSIHTPKISEQEVNRIRDLNLRDIRISKRARAQEIKAILSDGASAQCILGPENADQEEGMRTFSQYLKQRDRVAIALFPNDMMGLIITMENPSILHFLVVKAKMTHTRDQEKHTSSGDEHHMETDAVLSITQTTLHQPNPSLTLLSEDVRALATMRIKDTSSTPQSAISASNRKQLEEFRKRLTYFQSMQFHRLQRWSMTETSHDHDSGQAREKDETQN